MLDTVAPTIIASSILENDHITTPTITYTAVFSEAMATTGLSTSDMSLTGQTTGSRGISNFNYDAQTFTLTATFTSLPPDSYTLTLMSNANAFRDVAGNLLDGERNISTTVPTGNGAAGGNFVVHFTVPFAVTSTSPGEGTVLINPLTTINVNFNATVSSALLSADDLLIGGQPALSVSTVDLDTMRFTLPTLSEGPNIITIAEGAFTSLVGSHPIAAYTGSVIINRIGPRVIASSILHGEDVAPGHFVYVATFDEPMDAGRLDVTDVTLVGLAGGSHVAQSLTYDDATRSVTVDFGVLPADYYTLSLLSNGIGFRDSGNQYLDGERNPSGTVPSGDGQPLGDFVIEFQLEDPAGTPFPVPLEPRYPLGSMVYEGEFTTTLTASDTDTFLVPLDAGQRLNILVRPTSELRVGVVVRDAGGAVLFSEESLTGMPVVLNHLMSTGGTYEVAITSLDGSTGDASVHVSLNAAFETESVLGVGNDSLDAAQDIEPAFSTMGSDGGSIASVAGRAGRVIFSETYSNDLFAPNVLTFEIPNAPLPENNTSFSWGILTITAVGDLDAADEYLTIMMEGLTPRTMFDDAGVEGVRRTRTIDLSYGALSTLIADGTISFNIIPSEAVGNEGPTQLTITLEYMVADASDVYSFALEAGQEVTLVAASVSLLPLTLELLGPDGDVLVADNIGTGTLMGGPIVSRFVASQSGTYYARVKGSRGWAHDYTLSVIRDAGFDVEPNDTQGGAVNLTTTGGAYGYANTGPSGRLFAYLSSDRTIREIDPLTGAILNSFTSPVPKPSTGYGLATSPNGLLIGGAANSPIREVDPDTGDTIRGFTPINKNIDGMAYLNGEVFAHVSGATGEMYVFDYATGAVKRIVPAAPTLVAHRSLVGTADKLIGYNASSLKEIDTYTGATVTIGSLGQTGGSDGLGIIGNELFGASGSKIYVYDLSTLELLRTLTPGSTSYDAIGADGHGQPGDYFSVASVAGDVLTITTQTPGDEMGLVRNSLDPFIELLNASGTVVASNANGAPDGRNAALTFPVTQTGTYFIRVLAEGGTEGEYVLSVTGHTGTGTEPLTVTAVDPADGATLTQPLSQVTITFSDVILATSIDPGDLTIDGQPATKVTIVKPNTLRFEFATLMGNTHTLAINAGSLLDVQGVAVTAFTSQFTLDVAPRVIASSLLEGGVIAPGMVDWIIQLSEPINPATLNNGVFTRAGPGATTVAASSFSYNAATRTLVAQFATPVVEGIYYYYLKGNTGGVQDFEGYLLDGEVNIATTVPSGNGVPGGDFRVKVYVDAPTIGTFTHINSATLGSLAYKFTASRPLAAFDEDLFTFALDAGQLVSLLAQQDSSGNKTLQRIELIDPLGAVVAVGEAAGLGDDAMIQSYWITTGGIYTIRLTNLAGIGDDVTIGLFINSAVGPVPGIQNLDGAWRDFPLGGKIATVYTDAGGTYNFTAVQGDVLTVTLGSQLFDDAGNLLATTPVNYHAPYTGLYKVQPTFFSATWFSIGRNIAFDTESNFRFSEADKLTTATRAAGVVENTSSTTPPTSAISLPHGLADQSGNTWTFAPNGAVTGPVFGGAGGFAIDGLPSASAAKLEEFSTREYLIGPRTIGDISITRKGFVPPNAPWIRFMDTVTNTAATTQTFTYTLTTPLAAGADAKILATSSGDKFLTAEDDWIIVDDPISSGGLPVLLHYFDAPGGIEPATATMSADGTLTVTYELTLDPGQSTTILHYAAQSLDESHATMTLQTLEASTLPYYDTVNNIAMSFTGFREVDLITNFELMPFRDIYQLNVNAGEMITLETALPLYEHFILSNGLDPLLLLIDPTGAVVARDDNSHADGRNAIITHLATMTGPYHVLVASADGTTGSYSLRANRSPDAPPPFFVESTFPVSGTVTSIAPTTVTLYLSENVLASSVAADDLLINGQPATGVTIISSRELRFNLPTLVAGIQSLHIPEGALTGLLGASLAAFNGEFTFDTVAPRIVESSILYGDVVPTGPLAFVFRFNEPMRPDIMNVDGVRLTQGGGGTTNAASIYYDAASWTVTAIFPNVVEGTYTLTVLASSSAFTDLASLRLDGERNVTTTVPTGNGVAAGNFEIVFTTTPLPPKVTRVWLDSEDWSDTFRITMPYSHVPLGYGIPVGSAAQTLPLPWATVNRIMVEFDREVDVQAEDLILLGINQPSLPPVDFQYVGGLRTAVWTFSAALENDKYRIILSDRITSDTGLALDGEWTDGVSTVSGNGTPGGDFNFRFNVLVGDVNQNGKVRVDDVIFVRNAQFQPPGSAGYRSLYDMNGSGSILPDDMDLVRNHQFTELPEGEPSPASMTSDDGGGQLLAVVMAKSEDTFQSVQSALFTATMVFHESVLLPKKIVAGSMSLLIPQSLAPQQPAQFSLRLWNPNQGLPSARIQLSPWQTLSAATSHHDDGLGSDHSRFRTVQTDLRIERISGQKSS